MRRIFGDYAYGNGPRSGCWWDETCKLVDRSTYCGDQAVDIVVIGAGFTGLSAARKLAQAGASVSVLDMHHVGWGASGRNGGFCCLGGGKAGDAEIDRKYGKGARLAFRQTEKDAVNHVAQFLKELTLDVDQHSDGETVLAHRPKDMRELESDIGAIRENYGVDATLIEKRELRGSGMGGPFHGGLTIPIGFGLNPRKYVVGLASAAEQAGALIYERSPVTSLVRRNGKWQITSGDGTLRADQVILATNGYSSETIPSWLAGRYLPAQSTILVTRPLSQQELDDQGWTTSQMSYDTRELLHYFRLMPDRRFLFGMRGALFTGERAETYARSKTRQDFETMFPAWSGVQSDHTWSGMVSLARRKLPFVGPVPDHTGLWASLCYHGNGVAMASYSGDLLADQITGDTREPIPSVIQKPLERFPFGRWRRIAMPPLYLSLGMKDL